MAKSHHISHKIYFIPQKLAAWRSLTRHQQVWHQDIMNICIKWKEAIVVLNFNSDSHIQLLMAERESKLWRSKGGSASIILCDLITNTSRIKNPQKSESNITNYIIFTDFYCFNCSLSPILHLVCCHFLSMLFDGEMSFFFFW